MEDSRSVETEAEVDPYEEIVSLGDLNYSTPVTLFCTCRSVSPIRYEENKLSVATFQWPITHSSDSTVTDASTGFVASFPWPALRSSCSKAGKYQEARWPALRSSCSKAGKYQEARWPALRSSCSKTANIKRHGGPLWDLHALRPANIKRHGGPLWDLHACSQAGKYQEARWPALRSSCSKADKYQETRLHTRSGGSSATVVICQHTEHSAEGRKCSYLILHAVSWALLTTTIELD